MSASFDTLKFDQRLEQTGINPEQAAAFAEAQREALDALLDGRLASKADIDVLRSELDVLRSEFRAEIDILRSDFQGKFNLPSWMVGISLVISLTMLPMMVSIVLYLFG